MSIRERIHQKISETFSSEHIPFALLNEQLIDLLDEIYTFMAAHAAFFLAKEEHTAVLVGAEDATPIRIRIAQELIPVFDSLTTQNPVVLGKINGSNIVFDSSHLDDPISIDTEHIAFQEKALSFPVAFEPTGTAALHLLERVGTVEDVVFHKETGDMTLFGSSSTEVIPVHSELYPILCNYFETTRLTIGSAISTPIWFDAHLGFIQSATGELLTPDTLSKHTALDENRYPVVRAFLQANDVFLLDEEDPTSPIILEFDHEEQEIPISHEWYQTLLDCLTGDTVVEVGLTKSNDTVEYSPTLGYLIVSEAPQDNEFAGEFHERYPELSFLRTGMRLYIDSAGIYVVYPGTQPELVTQEDERYRILEQVALYKTGTAYLRLHEATGQFDVASSCLAAVYLDESGLRIEQWPLTNSGALQMLRSQKRHFVFAGGEIPGGVEDTLRQPTRKEKRITELKKLPRKSNPRVVFSS